MLFKQVSEKEPDKIEALRDFGLAASHAGHNQVAREALQRALEKQPGNVDVMCDLAAVNSALGDKAAALQILVRAHQAAPDRADVEAMLARTFAGSGYFGDAAEAWTAYLKAKPDDAIAIRERAFAETAIGENVQAATSDLERYVRTHPRDAAGHYELAIAESTNSREVARKELDRAIALNPDLAAARFARGVLLYREGDAAAALIDLTAAAKKDPSNPFVRDHLGEVYLSLDKAGEAVSTLRNAAQLAPDNSTILLHLGRALASAGETREAATVFARCRELGVGKQGLPHPAGLLAFLSLSPQEQAERYREGVERTVKNDPQNVDAQVRLLALTLANGEFDNAAKAAQSIAALSPPVAIQEEVVQKLIEARQYAIAKSFLAHASNGELPPSLRLYRVLADLHSTGAPDAMAELEGVPTSRRDGDYWLARFIVGSAIPQSNEAQRALSTAMRSNPTLPEFYCEASLELLKAGRAGEALDLLEHAESEISNNPEMALIRAIALQTAGRSANREFDAIQARWPDWTTAFVAHAVALAAGGDAQGASRVLDAVPDAASTAPAVSYCRSAIESGDFKTDAGRKRMISRELTLLFEPAAGPVLTGS
jgi:tetratricopeptide (TPR) repeat protein